MLTDELFHSLVEAASLAPSADNMQPWEFIRKGNCIEVYYARQRALPHDAVDMFGYAGIGAAVQNIVLAAARKGLKAKLDYNIIPGDDSPAVIIEFNPGAIPDHLAGYIPLRTTNRNPFTAEPLKHELIRSLSAKIASFNAGLHWTTSYEDMKLISQMDAGSSYIRLEHKPLHDELFDILRFSRDEMQSKRYGLDFSSLGVPKSAVFAAKYLQYWAVNRFVSKIGAGKLIAKMLSMRLRASGALCLITAFGSESSDYIEAGRAMEHLWLAATAEGLSVQPYGVLPQYLTKAELEPDSFLPKYISKIESHREPFHSVFPYSQTERPVILLRVGRAKNQSARSEARLDVREIIRQGREEL